MIAALRALGVPKVQFEENGEVLLIEGASGKLKATKDSEVRGPFPLHVDTTAAPINLFINVALATT